MVCQKLESVGPVQQKIKFLCLIAFLNYWHDKLCMRVSLSVRKLQVGYPQFYLERVTLWSLVCTGVFSFAAVLSIIKSILTAWNQKLQFFREYWRHMMEIKASLFHEWCLLTHLTDCYDGWKIKWLIKNIYFWYIRCVLALQKE